MPDPGCEPIILEKAEKRLYCFYCKREMLKHNNIRNVNFFECPTCGNSFVENLTN